MKNRFPHCAGLPVMIVWICAMIGGTGCHAVVERAERTMLKSRMESRRETVILVHGLARTRASMDKVEHFLTQQGYLVFNFAYPSTKHPIATLSEQYLKPFVQAHCAESSNTIHFVTHSMGGVLVRYYLRHENVSRLGRVVMLAPPNQGSEVTDWLKDWWGYQWLLARPARNSARICRVSRHYWGQ